jgi:hypothetical protein
MRALARLYDNRRWASSAEEAVWLESIGSRRLWDLIRQATEIGVVLLTAGRNPAPVTLSAEPATAELDAKYEDGALSLTARLVHSNQLLATESVLLVGEPAHGLVYWEEPLHPSRTPCTSLRSLRR